jgi:hypothetical protein
MRRFISSGRLGVIVLLASGSMSFAADWEATLSPFTPGSFPEPRPLRAHYSFGWNGITAATADVRFTKVPGDRLELVASGGTTGFARSLWTYDVKHTAVSDAHTLRPIEVTEEETLRKEEVTTHVTFTPERAMSVREARRGSKFESKAHHFDAPNILSVNSALLFLRTQPLTDGSVHRVVIVPATSAYLGTITVLGRERITVPTGTYDAIKVDLQLNKIDKNRQLKSHKKFRRAIIWLSDDPDRLILRAETQVFIGTVFAELQSVQFDNGKP